MGCVGALSGYGGVLRSPVKITPEPIYDAFFTLICSHIAIS
ncbi:hypothetical protein FHX76_002301 [Lysinibacter cavernae]|uniref:Uncharacterized protein n=1 Tax=Lysinibacter cavernae TaxID=1640652 RepID=A0A7X5R2D1_9MICO|nr:hypothetical protein [Lysinibacter cavernae]